MDGEPSTWPQPLLERFGRIEVEAEKGHKNHTQMLVEE